MSVTKIMLEAAFANKVLEPDKHMMLVGDLDKFAARANVAPSCLITSAINKLTPEQSKYLTKIHKLAEEYSVFGLVVVGDAGQIVNQMSLMIGVLVRALLDARMMPVTRIVDDMKAGNYPEASVLFIPNFYSPAEMGKYDHYKIAALGDVLTDRAAKKQQTVLGISTPVGLKEQLGLRVHELITENYYGLGANV